MDRQTKEYFQIFEENNFIATTKIKFGENLLKIIFQTYILSTNRYCKGLKGANAKTSILQILSDSFRRQLFAPLFPQFFTNFFCFNRFIVTTF